MYKLPLPIMIRRLKLLKSLRSRVLDDFFQSGVVPLEMYTRVLNTPFAIESMNRFNFNFFLSFLYCRALHPTRVEGHEIHGHSHGQRQVRKNRDCRQLSSTRQHNGTVYGQCLEALLNPIHLFVCFVFVSIL